LLHTVQHYWKRETFGISDVTIALSVSVESSILTAFLHVHRVSEKSSTLHLAPYVR